MPPKIEARGHGNILVDGVPAGNVVDVLINHGKALADDPPKRSDVLNGVLAALDAHARDEAAAHAADIKTLEERHAAELEALREAHDAALRAAEEAHRERLAADGLAREVRHRAAIEALESEHAGVVGRQAAEIQALKAQVDALGGTELAQRLRAEAELAEHERTLAHAAERAETLRAMLAKASDA